MSKSVPYKRAWHKTLKRNYPVKATQLIEDIQHTYQELYVERATPANPALDRHLTRNILTGIAVYNSLRRNDIPQQEAIDFVQAGFRVALKLPKAALRLFGRFPIFYTFIERKTKPMMQEQFPAPAFETEWVEISNNQVSFNLHQCYYFSTLQSYGIPELTPVYCDLDSYLYQNVSPHMEFKRSQTIGKGGTHCDFQFHRIRADQIEVN